MGQHHLLLSNAVPWAYVEGLEDVSIVCREFWIAEPPLRMVFFWFGEELFIVVQGVMVL